MSLDKLLQAWADKNNDIYEDVRRETFDYYVNNQMNCQNTSIYIISTLKSYIREIGGEDEIVIKIAENLEVARYKGIVDSINYISSKYNKDIIDVIYNIDKKIGTLGSSCLIKGLSRQESRGIYYSLKVLDKGILLQYLHKYINKPTEIF